MKNFELAARKPDLTNFALLPTGADLSWIETNLGAAGAPYRAVPTGTKNGVNLTFDAGDSGFTSTFLLKNGRILSETAGDYTLVGSTLTLAEAPLADDSLLFIGWSS